MIEKTNVMLISVSVVFITGLLISIRYKLLKPVVNVSNNLIDKYKDL